MTGTTGVSRQRTEVAAWHALFAGMPLRRLLAGTAIAASAVLAGLALLALSGWFVTAMALAGASALAVAVNVFAPSAAIRLLTLLRTGARYAERLVTHDATLSMLAILRVRLFRRWARADTARRLQARPARLLFRLGSDVDALDGAFIRVAIPLGSAALTAVALGALIGVFVDSGAGIATTLAFIVLGAATFTILLWRGRAPAVRRALALEGLRERIVDLVGAQTEWMIANRLQARQRLALAAERRLARADGELNRLDVMSASAMTMAGTVFLAAMLVATAALESEGRIDAPLAALALFGVLAAMEPFDAVRRGALEAARMRWSVRRLVPATAPSAAEPVCAPDTGIALHLAGIRSERDDASPLFDELTVTIAVGERVAIVGASGSGKSTLLDIATGERAPASGTVHALASSRLMQRTDLFNDTLRENLRLADPAAGDARLWAALDDAGLGDVVRALPSGLDARLGEGGSGLSGGQQRRLALARLLLQDRALWLLDEPTEGSDAQTARDVLARVAQLARGRTLVIATHLRREAALADRLLVLDRGRVIADVRRGSVGFERTLVGLRCD